MTEPDQFYYNKSYIGSKYTITTHSADFEAKLRDLLKKNRIMKETAIDGGIKLLFILEDFLDKNREQFNDLENNNMVMKRRIEELESTSNNFLGLVNKVEQEN